MNNNVTYVGLDVDDPQYHGAGFDKRWCEQSHPGFRESVALPARNIR